MDVDELYGAPLEQFVAERGELVGALRKQGEREEAARVAKLRKPSVAAWAVNQLVRTQSQSVAELFDAGDALRDAHRTAVAGGGEASTLRSAARRERSAVDLLVDAARGLLTSEGHELSPAVIERVAETLRAAALDPEARDLVADGRLERELRHVGLGVAADAGADQEPTPPTPAKRRAGRATSTTKKGGRPDRDTEADREQATEAKRKQDRVQAERLERERAHALKAARELEAKARRRAERTARAVRLAQDRRDRAEEDLRYAEQSLVAAQAEAETAAAEHQRATDALEQI
jgi:hypothetical protein